MENRNITIEIQFKSMKDIGVHHTLYIKSLEEMIKINDDLKTLQEIRREIKFLDWQVESKLAYIHCETRNGQ